MLVGLKPTQIMRELLEQLDCPDEDANGQVSPIHSALNGSLDRQRVVHRSSLILNPVENFPAEADLAPSAGFLHGLYNSDKVRTRAQQAQTLIQFGGRRRLAYDCKRIHEAFAKALGAAEVSLRLLSGLHAHIILFMAAAESGQTVLLLPERAGGHMSTKAILQRLGLRVLEMPIDCRRHCIDMAAAIRIVGSEKPDFIFVDRSEGLVFEDFSELLKGFGGISIFDASQYLTHIIAGDYPSPFGMGFDLMISSLHKNFPGPQKALIATRIADSTWKRILSAMSTYVSNMHIFSTYSAGLTLSRTSSLRSYSRTVLDLSTQLDRALTAEDVRVVPRSHEAPPTQHIWIPARDRHDAFTKFHDLERCRIYVNFRLLPYDIGFGLRLGLSFAARLGTARADLPELASIIADIFHNGAGKLQRRRARAFNERLWKRFEMRGPQALSSFNAPVLPIAIASNAEALATL